MIISTNLILFSNIPKSNSNDVKRNKDESIKFKGQVVTIGIYPSFTITNRLEPHKFDFPYSKPERVRQNLHISL